MLCCLSAPCGLCRSPESGLKGPVEITRNGHHVKDASKAVVWLSPVGAAPAPAPPHQMPQIPQLVQKNKSFQPSLLVIPVGGKVEFPNHDPFFHNVFSLFEGKRFDLGLYESGTTRFVKFDKPGISYIFCNIHAQMSAVIVALNTPYYAISTGRGDISIRNVAPGPLSAAGLPLLGPAGGAASRRREITVAPGDTFLGNFTLAESDIDVAHKNKYGRDYDRPDPDSPAYARP